MPDFWRSSGYHLLETAGANRLAVTNGFLRAYFMRPEVRPVAESCPAERKLHAELLDDPKAAAAADRLAAIADPDVRENYTLLLAFRDRLVAAGTVEDAYLGLFIGAQTRGASAPVPPLFVDQLVHVILRRILDGASDPLRLRAAELFFRPQRATINDGAIMLADEETIEMHAASGGLGSLGKLLVESNTPVRSIELDVLTDANAGQYWGRDERYDTVLDLTFGRSGLDALARVLEAWVRHFLAIEVAIHPVSRIHDERWVWHVGLDAEANTIMNDLYAGRDVEEERLARVLSLFRFEFANPSVMRPDIAGRPVYLGLAIDGQQRLRLKPQNLLANLPLAATA
ncbi:MAG: hypothetical protein HY057_07285 [Rhodospirillales bacterium]|nr:hypothetical protein [Rhodospirillales bacterium]